MAEASSYTKIKPVLEDTGSNMEVDEGNMEIQMADGEPTLQNHVHQTEQQNGTTNTISVESDTGHSHSLSFVLPPYIFSF